VGVGDLWYFPAGIPHSIQGLSPDGCEFLLVFDDGEFDEDDTFLLSDWFKHTPTEVLAKNFGVPASNFGHTPDRSQRYIFRAPLPGPLRSDKIAGASPVPQTFSYRMLTQQPIKSRSGTVRIVDSAVFLASKTIAAALVEVEPGACASCTGTPTRMNGNTTSRARPAWGCLPLPGRLAPSTSKPEMSAMCRSPWGTTLRIPAPRPWVPGDVQE